MWQSIATILQKYMGTGLIFVWFCVGLVYLFFQEKNRERRIIFVYVPVILLLVLLNPVFAGLFFRFLGSEIYFRFCWLLPVIAVIAASTVRFASRFDEKKHTLVLAAAIACIVVSGKSVYSNPLYSKAENLYHVPSTVIRICDAIHCPGREVRAAFPREFLLYVRQYDPTICMPYGREWNNGWINEFVEFLLQDTIDPEKLSEYLNQYECHFVILEEKKEIPGDLRDFDLKLFDTIDGYAIYQNTAIPLDY